MATAPKRIDMCNGPIFVNIIKYTVPIICTSILQLLFNAADLVIVGRFCGSSSVAAVGATNSLIGLIVNLFVGMSVGVSVAVATAVGERNEARISRAVHTAIPLGMIFGAIVMAIGLIFSKSILGLMGTPSEILPLSSLYTRIYFCGMIPTLVFEFSAAVLRASGDTKTPFKYLSIAGIVNVVLNVIFVTLIDMDVAGVALATAIAQTLSCFLIVRSLIKRNDAFKFDFKKMKLHKDIISRIVAIGLPSGLQTSLFSISNVLIQSSINSFGAIAVAGNAAAASIEGFVYVSMSAFHQTSLNYTGQNFGAKNTERMKKAFWNNLLCVTVISVSLIIVVMALSKPLLSLYISDSPESIAYGFKRLEYICSFYFLVGAYEVLNGFVRGLGYSLLTMFMSLIGVCAFRVVWIFTVFQKWHTLDNLYISYPISWTVCIIALSIISLFAFKKIKKRFSSK